MKVYLIGMGMGNADTLTLAAKRAVEGSDVRAGAAEHAPGHVVIDDVHRVRRVPVAGDAQHSRAPDEQRGLETECQECQGDRPDLEGCSDPIA